MAVEPPLAKLLLRHGAAPADYLAAVVDGARVRRDDVARLAQVRGLELQKRIVIGPVRVGAVRAVLPHRWGGLRGPRRAPAGGWAPARAPQPPLRRGNGRTPRALPPPLLVALETGLL